MAKREGLLGVRKFLNTLSGRFLILTTLFVLLAEVLIFVPSISRFREDYLLLRLERAQIASLATLANNGMVSSKLEKELLTNAGVLNVVLRRNAVRQLVLSSPIPQPIYATYDLRNASTYTLVHDALAEFFDPHNRIIRVIGNPTKDAGQQIEVTLNSGPMREAMIDYGLQVFALSAVISVMTALLLFFAVQRLMVGPIRQLVHHMSDYAEAPEDARRVIEPSASISELREAEEALKSLQKQLTGALKQKERLAQLGGAVAKISHDLRNILTTAQLFADRMENSEDPGVARAAPKLMNSIGRAVNLCEGTLAFGKAEEPPPTLTRFALKTLVDDVIEGETIACGSDPVTFLSDVPGGLMIRGDTEQLHRVLSNLVRNARQAIVATGKEGTIEISAGEDDSAWWIKAGDTGPGLPPKAKEHLFTPFQGGARKGGIGLGLAISAELVRGHGGRLELLRSDEEGTTFLIRLPKSMAALETGVAAS